MVEDDHHKLCALICTVHLHKADAWGLFRNKPYTEMVAHLLHLYRQHFPNVPINLELPPAVK
jgi:hypothetical protein